MQAVLPARAQLRAILNVAEVQSVGGYFSSLCRSMLDFAQDPETDVLDWLHSGVPSELSRHLGRTLCFHSRDRRNTSSPKLNVYPARVTSAGGLREKPSDLDFDGLAKSVLESVRRCHFGR